MNGRQLLERALLALSLLGLPAMATPAEDTPATTTGPAKVDADTEHLRERVAAFWAARVEGDSKAQWQLLEPRGRGRMTPGEYAPSVGAMKYLAYQVEDATVRGYFADVKVKLLVQPILPPSKTSNIGPTSTAVSDRWVRIGGTWYRSLEQELPPLESTGR